MIGIRAYICVCFVVLSHSAFAADGVPLIKDKDLGGWVVVKGPADGWHVSDGVLSCSGQGSGWLSTESQYDDFELSLEFRVPKGGNSGVFIRAPREGSPHLDGMEIQILDDGDEQYATLKPTQYTGSIYDIVPARRGATKSPGEWQQMVISCHADHIVVTLNGTVIVDERLDNFPDKVAGHPGMNSRSGYIGLQNHASIVDFRNIRVRELNAK
jgi:hypothetical protein